MRALLILLSIGVFSSVGFSQSTPAICDEVINLPQERPYLVSLADRSPRAREEQTLAALSDHFQAILHTAKFESTESDVMINMVINRRGEVAEFSADELPALLVDSLATSLREFSLIPARYQDRDVCSRLTLFVPLAQPSAATKLTQVERVPIFAAENCPDYATPAGKHCADIAMLTKIYRNIKYPPIARENGIEGTAIIQFIVNADGTARDHHILRNPGGGLGEEALWVVSQHLTQWIPAQKDGLPVAAEFFLPVKFKLE